MPLQIRRGTEAERLAMTVPLAPGEPLFTTDPGQQRLYIGNGTDLGGVLVSGYGNEDAIDAVGVALSNGVHQNITFTYGLTQDVNNRIDASIDLSNYQGVITADAIKSSIFAEDSSLLVDAADSKINLDGTVKGNIIPDTNENYDIGSPTFRFKDLYLSGSSLYLGNAQITASGSSVNLPAGSTLDGTPLGTLVPGNNYNINIVGNDSALIVNSADATITGTFFGDIKGSVFADDSSIMVDAVSNTLTASDGFFNNLFLENQFNGNFVNINNSGLIDIAIDTPAVEIGFRITTLLSTNQGGDIFRVNLHHDDSDSNEMTLLRTRGTDISQDPLVAGDEIFNFNFFGRGIDDLSAVAFIKILFDPTGTIGSDIVPGKIEFHTTNDSGVTASKLSIDKDGLIGLAANFLTAGAGSGQVDVGGGVVQYFKINVGGVDYAVPLYGINP